METLVEDMGHTGSMNELVELPKTTRETQLKRIELETNESRRLPRARILVVDDVPLILELIAEILTDEGYEVETVDNGRDALERIKNRRYSLLLTGIRMPYMNGFVLYENIKKIDQSLANRVIVISGSVEDADVQEFLTKNKLPYIAKPFNEEQLKRGINRISSRGK